MGGVVCIVLIAVGFVSFVFCCYCYAVACDIELLFSAFLGVQVGVSACSLMLKLIPKFHNQLNAFIVRFMVRCIDYIYMCVCVCVCVY